MLKEEFKKYGYQVIDEITNYFDTIEEYPVRANVSPGEIFNKIPNEANQLKENFEQILHDFEELIIPGMTHWQHPNFHAYFPANNSYPSILAEMLTASIGAQCMMWQTSPAATELEEKMMIWLRDMIGLPDVFHGVIQDTASTATLVSLLTAREKYTNYSSNRDGLYGMKKFKVYCSAEAHSSIEKAVKIAGLGSNNLEKIQTDDSFSLNSKILEDIIINDMKNDIIPLCVVACLGTTGSTAIDPLKEIGEICKKYNIWYHIDAAYSGTALILPEFRKLAEGYDMADTFVFNPHKWMFTNFDCSAYFVKDKEALIKTFEIMPEYLKTNVDTHVSNYRDWGIQLGRRFRALKLWFVIRYYGVEGLKDKLRFHISLAQNLVNQIENNHDFEILAPVPLNTICFQFYPGKINKKIEDLNALNESLLNKINDSGKLFISHTKLKDKYALRFVIGQTNVNQTHVDKAWDIITKTAYELI